MSGVLQIVFYGLLAGASPGTLVASLGVLGTKRPRANGTAFAAGFLLGQAFALAVLIVVGSVTIPGSGTGSAALEIAVGVLLLVAAARARRPAKPRPAGEASRTARLLERVSRVTPRTAFSIAFTLGIGAKRLIITALAASAIALADATRLQALGLGLLYVAIAAVLVWMPIGVYLVAGSRADEWVVDAKAALVARQRQLTFLISLVFGLLFVIDGVVELI